MGFVRAPMDSGAVLRWAPVVRRSWQVALGMVGAELAVGRWRSSSVVLTHLNEAAVPSRCGPEGALTAPPNSSRRR